MPDGFAAGYIGSVIFGGLGFVAFTYGKRMHHWTPMICGLGLMLLPLFVEGAALFISSVVLSAAAIVFRRA